MRISDWSSDVCSSDLNPLRILDSKDEGDRRIVAGAPSFADHLNPASADFFAAVCEGLDDIGVAYTANPRLVRGLDYYTHTRSEERRVGKECVSTCRSRWSPFL